MFVRGSTTKREDEVADAARTANPDEIDIDDDDDDDDDEDDGKPWHLLVTQAFEGMHFVYICVSL